MNNLKKMSTYDALSRSARFHRVAFNTLLTIGLPTLLCTVSLPATATQLSLAQSPLFLSAHVPANVFFLTDDSGSMDWHMVTTEDDGVMFLTAGGDTRQYSYLFPDSNNQYSSSDTNGRILPDEDDVAAQSNMPSNAHGVWRGRYHGYNKLFYNPDVNYKPWQGVDSAGNGFKDAKAPSTDTNYIAVTAVRVNPYSSSSSTVNLTSNMTYTAHDVPRTTGSTLDMSVTLFPTTYYTWTDTDGDGVVDASDAHTKYEIRTSGTCSTGATCPSSFTRSSTRTDCATVSGSNRVCTATEELQNFANWYMYYRRREHTAKAGLGNVIAPKGSEVRMGHATLHNNSGSSNIQVAQMNTSTTSGAKKSLLDAVYSTNSMNGTPLRDKLDEVGRYFECTSGSIFGGTSSYTCPILSLASGGNCQQNFVILMTDGYWNDSFSSFGNKDGDASSSYDGGAYADSYSNTLADVAMHYYERDLSSLANNVPVIAGLDNATHQHVVTYTVAFGVNGTLSADPTSSTAAFTWPNPTTADANKIDDLRHAAYNGRGEFLSAADPATLSTALQSAIASITDRTGSASAVAVNSRSLSTNTKLFQGRFTSGEWTGDLRAISIDPVSGGIGSQTWSAKTQLANQNWDTGRAILTYKRIATYGSCSAGTGTDGGVAFRWSNLSSVQQCLLNDDPTTSSFDSDTYGDERVDYLRGSTSEEGQGANFRTRSSKFGDIINSSPIFVGAPVYIPDLETTPHSTFRNTYFNRTEMIYVGANDGMLHGFDASTGNEKIAYVPSMVYPNLNQLSHPTYSHRYYVDGSPGVGDAYGAFGTTRCGGTSPCWRTVLVGGLAGGGKGVYALDVTDPSQFSETNASKLVLWEFLNSTTTTPSNNLGNVYGEIAIGRMQNGKWAAIFGNGYNSVNENAVLYIVDLVDGSLIKELELNPYASATGNSNGLAAPAVVDVDGDYIIDYIYAGDLRGNMWKVDVTNSNPNSWSSAYKQGSTPTPLFVAVDASNNAQAITVRPDVSDHPDSKGGYMVYFGTGRYAADGDKTPATSPINAFYGIWDKNTNSGSTPVARADLLSQSISTATVSSQTVRTVSNNTIDWKLSSSSGTHLGWVLNLRTNQSDSTGEMQVSNPVLIGGTLPRVIFTTLIPENSACSFGGSSWLMEVSPKNGGRLSDVIFDINGDGVADSSDTASSVPVSGINPGIGIMPEPVILRDPANKRDFKVITGSTGDVKSQKNFVSKASGGRQSWRQLK